MTVKEIEALREIYTKESEKCNIFSLCESCKWNTPDGCDCGLNLFVELIEKAESEAKKYGR